MKRIAAIIIVCFNIICANAQVPTLTVTTINEEMPTCDYVFPPTEGMGISTANQKKVPGRAVLSLNDSIIFDSGDYEEDVSGMTIRIRGNTSAYYFSKKPYKIKLEKKADMLGRDESRFYDKNWILVSVYDQNINHILGLKMNEILGLGGWTPAYVCVELYLNKEYCGVYMLMENIRRNADCRIDVDKQTGYLIERDPYWWNEPLYFKTALYNKEYTFKYPEDDEVSDAQVEYIENWINDFEERIDNGPYEDFIDVESFALWMLGHDLLGTYDSGGSNLFLTKYDNTTSDKLKMSTLWDFDSAFRNNNKWARIHEDSFFYYPLLFDSENPTFRSVYKSLWNQNKDKWIDEMISFLQDFRDSESAYNLQAARMNEAEKLEYEPVSVYTNIEDAIQWFTERKEWLDTKINEISTDIVHTIENHRCSDTHLYNINGQRIGHEYQHSGIYIKNGKKIVR